MDEKIDDHWAPPDVTEEFADYDFYAEPYGRFSKKPDGPARIGDDSEVKPDGRNHVSQ